MVKISVYEQFIGMDLAVSKTVKIVMNDFYQTDAGQWIASKPECVLRYDIHNDHENMGLRLEFFSYMNEDAATEFIMRFK
jgi:hypothetical protein